MFEYACHEGNYAMRNTLSGSRADEKRWPIRSKGKGQRAKGKRAKERAHISPTVMPPRARGSVQTACRQWWWTSLSASVARPRWVWRSRRALCTAATSC